MEIPTESYSKKVELGFICSFNSNQLNQIRGTGSSIRSLQTWRSMTLGCVLKTRPPLSSKAIQYDRLIWNSLSHCQILFRTRNLWNPDRPSLNVKLAIWLQRCYVTIDDSHWDNDSSFHKGIGRVCCTDERATHFTKVSLHSYARVT